MQTNYFKLVTTTDWNLYQYRVEFFPDEERTPIRKGLVKSHKDTLGPYVFDGGLLYSIKRVEQVRYFFSELNYTLYATSLMRYEQMCIT